MLIQFLVGNYRCFRDETLLNLFPAKRIRTFKGHLLSDGEGKKVQALPIVALYGANASGKTTLVRAIGFARKLILNGTRADQPIRVTQFRLDEEYSELPSKFEFVIKHEGVLYTYGFTTTTQVITEEWLFGDFGRGEEVLFERATKDSKALVEVGKRLGSSEKEKQRMQFVAEGTRQNQLFLTEANERNVEGVKALYNWFSKSLVIVRPESEYHAMALRAHTDQEFSSFLERLLVSADTGISKILCEAEPLEINRHLPGIPDDVYKNVLSGIEKEGTQAVSFQRNDGRLFAVRKNSSNGTPEIIQMRTAHKTKDGKLVPFETEEESDGTRRIMHLAAAMLEVQNREITYIVDELDRSLHPHLSKFLLELFLAGTSQKGNRGQLVFTTHETSLLDRELLRPDEIWFVEKDSLGGSHMMSLSEFKLHHTLKVERGYLNGRFGAIPMVGDVRKLLN